MNIWLIVVGLLILGLVFYSFLTFFNRWKMRRRVGFMSKKNFDALAEYALGKKKKKTKWFQKWFR